MVRAWIVLAGTAALTLFPLSASATVFTVKTDATWLTTDTAPPVGWNTDISFDTSDWIDAFKSPSGDNIWYGSNRSAQSPNQAWFRDVFNLDGPVTSAIGNFFFDDNGQNYLNGHLLIDDTGGGATSFKDITIDPSWFNVGENVFAIHGIDTEGPFSNVAANITINTAPEPATILLLPAALFVIGRRRPRS